MSAPSLKDISTQFQSLVDQARSRVACVGNGKAIPRSGLLIGNGEIVTTARAADKGEPVPVQVGETEYTATVTGFDAASGIALLSAPEAQAPPIDAGALPGVGSLSVTVACPVPGDYEARLGMIRCVGGATRMPGGRRIDSYLQTDATRFRGFAGSVVFGPEGEVLGMTMPVQRREEGYVIPTSQLLAIVEQLRSGDSLGTGYLGIQATAVDLPEPRDEYTAGLLVTGVEAESPAERAGLQVGTFVVRVGEKPTPDLESLYDTLVGLHEGADLPLTVIRSSGELELIAVKVALRK